MARILGVGPYLGRIMKEGEAAYQRDETYFLENETGARAMTGSMNLSGSGHVNEVWGWDFGDDSTVVVHVRRLRRKFEPDPASPVLLTTVRGTGYRLATADELTAVLRCDAIDRSRDRGIARQHAIERFEDGVVARTREHLV